MHSGEFHDGSVTVLAVALSAVGVFMATVTLALCAFLCIKRREFVGMTIVRVISLLQILEILRCTFDIISIYAEPATNTGCRVLVFFTLVLWAAPLNLSVVCMLYFQAVLIHNIKVRWRHLRLALLAAVVVYTVVPSMFTLIIPPHTAGMGSYCEYYEAPNSRLFVFQWLVFYIWLLVMCVAGLGSITAMMVAIFRRSREANRRICSATSAGQPATGQPCSVSSELNATVVREIVKQQRRRSSGLVVVKTLQSMIWFSIAPIISLAFHMVYTVVWYRTREMPLAVAIIDQVLQFLTVPLYCLSFYLNPCVQRAVSQYLHDRKHPASPPDSLARLSNRVSSLNGNKGPDAEKRAIDDSSSSPGTLPDCLDEEYYTDPSATPAPAGSGSDQC
ncbi:hypothetical protein H4R21_000683 [Coemansia helicoidea]|uniref:Uncharacterized protein n=1 Tax=Coemansia helicoidea TaxID=1286919 RepID=A0ACC1LFC1_9FUNG|nr:hypothetical protein H4R21_000683 [Coemansia helicoidea]